MQEKKLDLKELLQKVEDLAQKNLSSSEVVELDSIRQLKKSYVGKTLLVVEDDATIRLAMNRVFCDEGFNVLSVSDGKELFQVLGHHKVDLILLDVGLPWVDGFQLAELMQSYESVKNIPVIFVSGEKELSKIKKGFKVGAFDFITKPFDLKKLKKAVFTVIDMQN